MTVAVKRTVADRIGETPRFIARRLLALLATVIVLSFLVFLLQEAAPGSPEQTLTGGRAISAEGLEALREKYNLDGSVLARYGAWLEGALQGDFGTSIQTGESVTSMLAERTRSSLLLAGGALLFAITFGFLFGVLAAVRQRSTTDRAVVTLGIIALSIPAFATGLILIYVFAVVLGWFPAFGGGDGVFGTVRHMFLPVIAATLTVLGFVIKIVRAAMIDVLDQEYVFFARARGISKTDVIRHYGVRNALVPVLTAAGPLFGYLITGLLLVEVTFTLPGLGSLLVESIERNDVPVVQGVVIVVAVVIVLVNLLVDLLYPIVDPTIRLGETGQP